MADIELTTANKVEVVENWEPLPSFRAGEAITAGAPITFNSSGDWVNADANGTTSLLNVRAIATKTVTIGQALTGLKRGILDGFVLTSQAYMAPIYASNTVGRLADAAGGTSIPIGRVMPATAVPPITTAKDKLLYVDISWQEDLLV
jgi:hypothetical protein